jgi:hypothetical protein
MMVSLEGAYLELYKLLRAIGGTINGPSKVHTWRHNACCGSWRGCVTVRIEVWPPGPHLVGVH